MAPLYKTTAAVCLVALCGLHTEASTPTYKFTVEDVQADAYLSANLARNGKLLVRISVVAEDDTLVNSLRSTLEGTTGDNAGACKGLITPDLKETFHHNFVYQADADTTPNYRHLLQEAVEAGLAAFENKTYPQTKTEWQKIWSKDAGANLAYLLGSDSTRIGCLIGSEEYFNGLLARTTELKDMTADDLQTPVGDGAEAAAVPTILIAGLVAMLTLVSA
ncbi:uncharacterized protein EMH_0099010 [Eimeria mitis]|uniref:SAG family member n=1 Tax=Eimeria mitis TaxID=44415 RepID=U6JRR1_9EIME|nr:uncharacterized protein EMH_0099010 [Eimeria mitis]CDJ28150.1 hypothetical protein EMH_0099010 [Eimeria mitis]